MNKVLFLDTVHPYLEEQLLHLGYAVDHDFEGTKASIEQKIADYAGVIIRSRIPLDQTFLKKATNLKFIARSGAGLENIDVAFAEQQRIAVFNAAEGNKDAVGEHVIGMLLMLFNRLKKGDSEVRNHLWKREANRGLEIAGKTIGIIGYGNMGSALAKKLSGFDCTVLAHDKYLTSFQDNYAQQVSLAHIFEETDILSIHLPLSEETHHYVDDAFLSSFKKNIYVVNTARGNNVNTEDLVTHIKNGKVLGACLDVLEYESAAFEQISTNNSAMDYLFQSDQVILSPHVAGWTQESYQKLSAVLADKIKRAFH